MLSLSMPTTHRHTFTYPYLSPQTSTPHTHLLHHLQLVRGMIKEGVKCIPLAPQPEVIICPRQFLINDAVV